MKTLYDLLGIGSQATLTQVEQGYKHSLDALKDDDSKSAAEGNMRLQAIREAYLVLSSPARRQAYDDKLKASQQAPYEIVESSGGSLKLIVPLIIAILAAGYFYCNGKVQEKARLELEVVKVKEEAKRAALTAEAEQAKLEVERIAATKRDEESARREMEQARRDGQTNYERNQQMAVRANYEAQQADRQKQQAERQAKYDRDRDDQAARDRVRRETDAMERALRRPIARY